MQENNVQAEQTAQMAAQNAQSTQITEQTAQMAEQNPLTVEQNTQFAEQTSQITEQNTQKKRFFTTRNLTVMAMLTAISFVLYLFVKFPLPFFPSFLDIQFSDMPALLGGFMMGPMAGCIIIVIKGLLKMPFSGTLCVGEVGDILIGIAFVLPSALLYKRFRTKKGAIASLAVGSGSAIVMSLIVNAFILIPLFAKLFSWEMLLSSLAALFPSVTRQSFMLFYLPLSVLPFNILRCIICALITFLVYKGTEKIINSLFSRPIQKKATGQLPRK